MASTNGVYSLADLLAVRNASAASFGMETLWATVQMETAYANARVNEMLADFCQPITEQQFLWGGGGKIAMDEVDEYGLPLAKKNAIGVTGAAPLRMFKQALGFTEEYFEQAKVNEWAEKMLELRKGYFGALTLAMKKAIYGVGGNYSFTDKLTNGVSLAVKCLINADSSSGFPDSPAGVVFDTASHTHLGFDDTVDASAFRDLYQNVTEHGNTKGLKCYIASADLAELATLTTIFKPLDSALLSYMGSTSTLVRLDNQDLENQLVGYLDGFIEVWVKPWAITQYPLVVATGMPEKLLAYRQRPNPALQGWRIAATYSDYPLIAEFAKAEFGFAVMNRTMGAISLDAGSWTAPTITS